MTVEDSDEEIEGDEDEHSLSQNEDQIAIQNPTPISIEYDNNNHIEPISSFRDLLSLGVEPWLVEAVERLGWTTPTPIQAHLYPVWLNTVQERSPDILARAPTGSGKTAAYLLPILHHLSRLLHAETTSKLTKIKSKHSQREVNRGDSGEVNRERSIRALIVTPTRELAQQINHLATTLLSTAPHTVHVHVLGKSIAPLLRPGTLLLVGVVVLSLMLVDRSAHHYPTATVDTD